MILTEVKVKSSPQGNNKFISFDLTWILYAVPTAYKNLVIPAGTMNHASLKKWTADETVQVMDKSKDVKLILKNGDEIVVEGEWFQYITRRIGHSAYDPKY